VRIRIRHIALLSALACGGCSDSIHDLVNREDFARAEMRITANPAQVNARTPLGKTPLHYAVTYGNLDFIDFLVIRGANVNAADHTGLTPLHVAAMLRRIDEAESLLKHGAQLEARDAFGDTPFQTAAIFGQSEMLQFLADAGANTRTLNNNADSPLDSAIRAHKDDAVATIQSIQDQDD
jgi:ankyrin repeat protein